jgi:hypothetical protein
MRAAVFLFLLLSLPASAAQKQVDHAPGRAADKLVAAFTNEAGDKLSIWGRHEGDYAVLLVEFQRGDGQEFADEMPTFQLDTYKWPLETDWMRVSGIRVRHGLKLLMRQFQFALLPTFWIVPMKKNSKSIPWRLDREPGEDAANFTAMIAAMQHAVRNHLLP